jgi:hypothetical protein
MSKLRLKLPIKKEASSEQQDILSEPHNKVDKDEVEVEVDIHEHAVDIHEHTVDIHEHAVDIHEHTVDQLPEIGSDNDDTVQIENEDNYDENNNIDNQNDNYPDEQTNPNFNPVPPDYVIRQQQIASYQMLCQFLIHQDKNITETLNDVRVSIDCLTKCIMKLSKHLENKTT